MEFRWKIAHLLQQYLVSDIVTKEDVLLDDVEIDAMVWATLAYWAAVNDWEQLDGSTCSTGLLGMEPQLQK
jgi:hypothetical protein